MHHMPEYDVVYQMLQEVRWEGGRYGGWKGGRCGERRGGGTQVLLIFLSPEGEGFRACSTNWAGIVAAQ